jgi:hypothetical protein
MNRVYVTDQEASLLALTARRLLRAKREAQARGETYNDLTKPVPVACGVRVKLRFIEIPGGYDAEVHVVPHPSFGEDELRQIASEVIGYEAVQVPYEQPINVQPIVQAYRKKP